MAQDLVVVGTSAGGVAALGGPRGDPVTVDRHPVRAADTEQVRTHTEFYIAPAGVGREVVF